MQKLKAMYTKMNQREKTLLFVTFGFILMMIMDLLVLGPILEHIKVLDGEIKSKSESIQRNMRVISFKQRIFSEYHKYDAYFDTGDRSSEEIIAGLLRKIETLALQNNIKLINVLPGEIEEKPIYQIYATSLEYEGSLADIIRFISQLEESDNLFQVTRYEFTPKARSGAVLKASMDIQRVLMVSEDLESVFGQEALTGPAGGDTAAAGEYGEPAETAGAAEPDLYGYEISPEEGDEADEGPMEGEKGLETPVDLEF